MRLFDVALLERPESQHGKGYKIDDPNSQGAGHQFAGDLTIYQIGCVGGEKIIGKSCFQIEKLMESHLRQTDKEVNKFKD